MLLLAIDNISSQGGVCIDVSRMDEVISVNHADMDVTVQPGVTRVYLNTYLRDSGLWFPIGESMRKTETYNSNLITHC